MSFVQVVDSRDLVRDEWPMGIARLAAETLEGGDIPEWQRVPHGLEALAEWAFVSQKAVCNDPTRHHSFVHCTPDSDGFDEDLYQVVVRLQGFLAKFDFRPLGNWDGEERNACKAQQTLTLSGGQFPRVFESQSVALENIRDLICRQLGQDCKDGYSLRDSTIFCKRRVFRKVRGQRHPLPSVLLPAEDRFGQAKAIESRWRVVDRARFGVKQANGRVRSCNPILFSEGDFVDVAATLDVANFTRDGRPVTDVHLSFDHVIQLCAVSSPIYRAHLSDWRRESGTVRLLNSTLEFDEAEGAGETEDELDGEDEYSSEPM
ncbi:hypothetical protein BV25DRAFT_1912310 [Artomyces pyxidatus]|uniref:Uncharacterized protein n=1 Tax=Artomyces pyxidatus TaxID=48021 RepID=A0ACB8TEW3_9AGAM|nr:hypothetical protein BV25DRAFT_1912310 [Artomyces pyxidatus]